MPEENIIPTETPGEGAGQGEGAGNIETGEAAQGEAPAYAGFETPEALIEAYQKPSGQVQELESLKGRLANDLGEARGEAAEAKTEPGRDRGELGGAI